MQAVDNSHASCNAQARSKAEGEFCCEDHPQYVRLSLLAAYNHGLCVTGMHVVFRARLCTAQRAQDPLIHNNNLTENKR